MLYHTIAYSPTEFDKFESKVNEEPNSWSGSSNDTGLFFSNITMSSVVVAIGFCVDVAFGMLLLKDDDEELGWKRRKNILIREFSVK